MAFSTINKSSLFQNNVLYTGNGSADHTITGVGFNADLVWNKLRSGNDDHRLFDQVRGITKYLESNNSNAEVTDAILATNSDGYVLANAGEVNANNGTYVGWNWKANGAGSSNTDGDITSTVSVNTTAGFSICKVVKSGTSVETFGHGLGVAPSFIIGKSMTGGSYRWIVYHKSIDNTHAMYLNENFAKTDSVTFWNDVTPTSSLVTLGSDNSWNGTNIFYCFSEISGYSKFGSYIGNSSADGTFVYTGFSPSFLMIKCTSGTEDWWTWDNKRDTYNVVDEALHANTNAGTDDSDSLDFLSNGFKWRVNSGARNASSTTYTYMAFGQPIISNSGVSATAR